MLPNQGNDYRIVFIHLNHAGGKGDHTGQVDQEMGILDDYPVPYTTRIRNCLYLGQKDACKNLLFEGF